MARKTILALLAAKAAEKFWGSWYCYGGQGWLKAVLDEKSKVVQDPGGLDCSGVIVETLKCVGRIGEKDDLSAQMMADKFPKVDYIDTGCVLCWGEDDKKVTHATFCIAGSQLYKIGNADSMAHALCIDAAGGGSETKTEAQAAERDAYVKLRTALATQRRGKNLACVVDPFWYDDKKGGAPAQPPAQAPAAGTIL